MAGDTAWARLRTDGKTTKLTYKQFESNAIDGVKELEVVVSDFDTTHEMMQALGFKDFIYQENRRTNYTNAEVEVSLDEWPLIPAYAEIEANDKQTVEMYLDKLDIGDSHTTSEPTSKIYEHYQLNLDDYQHLSFSKQS